MTQPPIMRHPADVPLEERRKAQQEWQQEMMKQGHKFATWHTQEQRLKIIQHVKDNHPDLVARLRAREIAKEEPIPESLEFKEICKALNLGDPEYDTTRPFVDLRMIVRKEAGIIDPPLPDPN